MKILQVTTGLEIGKLTGAEKFCYELSKELSYKGHEVLICSPVKKNKIGKFDNQKIVKIKNKVFRKLLFDYYNPLNERKMKKIIKEFNPDIVHFHNLYGLGSRIVDVTSQIKPTLMTLHDYWIIDYNATLLKSRKDIIKKPLSYLHLNIIRKHLKRTKLISPSNYLKLKVQSKNFHNVREIPNGIDLPIRSTNYKKDILFVGRLTKEKGLQTIAPVLNDLKDYTVIALGDGPLKKKLEEEYHSIKFKGFQNPKKYYKHASIMIVPSIWHENLSYSVLEAMSYGLCVVASDIGGIPEQIQHMKTGLLFKPGNEEDFKEKLDYLIKKPSEIRRMGKNAKKFVMERFNWKNTILQYEKEYSDTIKLFKKKYK